MTGKKSLGKGTAVKMRLEHTVARRTGNTPEEVEEADGFDNDADERPLEEDEEDAADEAHRAPQLLFPREEVERFVRPDDERQPREEQDLPAGDGCEHAHVGGRGGGAGGGGR